jgi:hypothetical protein
MTPILSSVNTNEHYNGLFSFYSHNFNGLKHELMKSVNVRVVIVIFS